MRKYTTSSGTFYYPELGFNLLDTDEVKIIVENPTGYVEGDLVRLFYTFASNNIQVGVNTFEMFSPLVKDGAILRAIFYLPLSVEFANDRTFQSTSRKRTEFFIKAKGSTDFGPNDFLHNFFSFIYLTGETLNDRSNPIPVFFFSERGAGLFENTILNRQDRVADTNFSSVAIRQYKFNPFDMEIGGRNLLLGTGTGEGWVYSTFENGIFTRSTTGTSKVFINNSVKIGLERNTKYTLSAWIRSDGQVKDVGYYVYDTSVSKSHSKRSIPVTTSWQFVTFTFTTDNITDYPECTIRFDNNGSKTAGVNATLYVKEPKLEKGDEASPYAPNPEDYEVTEVVSGADLAGGLAKFDSSYAFKLLDDSEWVTKKLVCPEDHIQLFWGEPRSVTRFSFWFKIKEIEKSSEAWGEVEHYRELRTGTDVKERRKDVTKYRFPKTKLRLSSGVFRQDIIDKLKGIAHSLTIYKYNPYTKLNEGRGVIAQVTELRILDGIPTEQVGTGHFKLNYASSYSNTIEELIDSPGSVFDLEFSVKGKLSYIRFLQNRDKLEEYYNIPNTAITESNFTKKTFNGSITIDRSKKVKPALRFVAPTSALTEIKDIYIKGSLGGIEDVEVEIATMNIIPHQDGESEMELTVISDDFRKPDYLYF